MENTILKQKYIPWSISNGAQQVTLDSKIKRLSLAVLFFDK
jgi:hypothetical protein